MDIVVKVLVGFVAGLISGMGAGGGSLLLLFLNKANNLEHQKAGGINLVFFVLSGIAALTVHTKNKFVEYKVALYAAGGGVIAAFFASKLAELLDGNIIRKVFACGVLAYSLFEIYNLIRNNCKNREKINEK